MNWLDIIVIILLVTSLIGGFISGLIKTVFSLAGLIVGVVVAGQFYISLSEHLAFISNQTAARITAFIILFLIVIIIAAILGVIFTKLVSAIPLGGWLNRMGGAVLGVVMSAIFLAAILTVWIKFLGQNSTITGSAIAPFLVGRFPLVLSLLPKEFESVRQFFQ
jgi:membrane protein required for colicin V production